MHRFSDSANSHKTDPAASSRRAATARRLREAAFLHIQTPAEAQLRTELARRELVAT